MEIIKEVFNHPELKDNEIFLTNRNERDFELSEYKSKRYGIIPYNIYGKPIENTSMVPMFVTIEEFNQNKLYWENFNIVNSSIEKMSF